MWVNKKLYWSWVEDRKKDEAGRYIGEIPDTPTEKRIDYVTVNEGSTLLHPDKAHMYLPTGESCLAIGVWGDEKYTPLNRDELTSALRTYAFKDAVEKPIHGTLVRRLDGS